MLRNKQADQTSGLQPGEAEAGRKPSIWFGPLGGWQCSLWHTGSLVCLPSICLPPGSILALWRFCSAPLLWSPRQMFPVVIPWGLVAFRGSVFQPCLTAAPGTQSWCNDWWAFRQRGEGGLPSLVAPPPPRCHAAAPDVGEIRCAQK